VRDEGEAIKTLGRGERRNFVDSESKQFIRIAPWGVAIFLFCGKLMAAK